MKRDLVCLATIFGIVCLLGQQQANAGATGDAKRGEQAFKKATCASCHPGGGNIVNPKDPLKGPKFAAEFKDDAKIEKVVRDGIKGTPMPAFSKARLSDEDLKDIVAYIRSLTPKSGK